MNTTNGAALDSSADLELRVRAQAALLRRQRGNEARYAADPWAFLVECVNTVDQVTGKVRPFPRDKAVYLEPIVREWNATRPDGSLEYPLFAIAKSRRMFLTWLMVGLHYWLVRFRANQTVAFVSRKQGQNDSEGSAELVRRARFIHDHTPPELRRPQAESKFCYFGIPEHNSNIQGVGQGPDQLRQLTISAGLFDEFAFWEWAKDTYIAARPTIEGGGRLTLVSSPNPGHFKQLVFDEV